MESRKITNSSSKDKRRGFKNIAHVCRLVVGAIYIVSGFVKVVDPWGTALKINEYLTVYGLEWAIPASMVFAIWVSGAEMMMGCMLSFKVRIQLVSIFALFSTTMFTVMTLLGATVLRIEDCGCFGDALQLTPWQTVFKNLLLLPMAFIVFLRYKGSGPIFHFKKSDLSLATFFFLFTMGLGTYCYLNLPLIDFLPYRVGVNLQELIEGARRDISSVETQTTLVYRSRESGEVKEFSLEDLEWQDGARWEWVETRSVDVGASLSSDSVLISEFALYNSGGRDCTNRLLGAKGVVHLLVVADRGELSDECLRDMGEFVARVRIRGESVVCVTSDVLERDNRFIGVECFNLDKVNRKALLRARSGVVTLSDGVIISKNSCRNIL